MCQETTAPDYLFMHDHPPCRRAPLTGRANAREERCLHDHFDICCLVYKNRVVASQFQNSFAEPSLHRSAYLHIDRCSRVAEKQMTLLNQKQIYNDNEL